MSNLTEALIAAKLVGGSGGGSGLPEIRTETTTILAEQSVAFSKDQGGMYIASVSGQYPINVGDSITVNWDGTTYECIVGEMMGYTMWGNLAIAGGSPDTGEPFCMVTGEGGMEMYAASGESHTVELISTSYNPPAGSILIVENREWTEKLLSDYLPVNISVSSSTAVTVPAKNTYVFTGSITALGAPSLWKTCVCYASNLVTNGNSQPTGLQVANASLDLTAGTAQIVFVNNTAASITATGGFNTGGLFMKLS